MGRFEAKILGALLLAALGPFFASVALVDRFVEETIAIGVNEDVLSLLRDSRALYPEFIRTTNQYLKDQVSRLAEAPEVIAVAVEAEELFGPPEMPEPEALPAPPPEEEEEAEVLLLVPDSLSEEPETSPASEPVSEPTSEPVPVVLGPVESLRASIALARALEEARQRIGLTGEVRILDAQGLVLARLPAREPEEDEEPLRRRSIRRPLWRPVGQAVSIEADISISWSYFEGLDRGDTVLPVYRDLTRSIDPLKRSYLLVYLLVLGCIVAVVTTLGVLFARRATRRVTELIDATQKVAKGDLSTSVPEDGNDEISKLARSFNRMVSDVKESRARVIYLERIGAWKDIARRLAHEIKNPLTPIRLAVQQVRSSYRGDDPRFLRLIKEVDEIVEEEIESLRTLVEEFSEFARLPDITPVPEDLTAFTQEFCEQNPRFSEKISLSFTPGPKLPVLLDRRAMRRALLNLIKNAAEAIEESGKGSRIVVSTRMGERERAILCVADDGPGIPEELREKIFDPYYTSKENGTGLGLAIVKRAVFEHGGEIFVAPGEEGGAVFTLSFPLASAREEAGGA